MTLALAAAWTAVLEGPQKNWRARLLLAVLAACCLLWTRGGPPLWLALPCVIFGSLAFAAAQARPAAGAFFGLWASAMGFCAGRWEAFAEAFSRLGHLFTPSATRFCAPFFLALCLALIVLAKRRRYGLGMALLWVLATGLTEWRLRAAYGFGPADLTRAAGLSAEPPPVMAVAWLGDAKIGSSSANSGELSLSTENLDRLERYMAARAYRGVFVREAVEAVRRGRLFWWDAEAALTAEMAGAPMLTPDYRQALALLRAGPLTEARFDRLRHLAELAGQSPKGFESITQSQYIFEAFSAAFGRFGEAESARSWLGKIDRLWPIYEKRVEASPVEGMIDGMIAGSVLLDGRPASSVKVGLFYVSGATDTYRDGANLCCSQYADSGGEFIFSNLGEGKYRLALQAPPGVLRGRIRNDPGVVVLRERTRVVRLDPILIERR